MRGSHTGYDCKQKERIKRDFVEDKIRRYGVRAETAARSLLSDTAQWDNLEILY